MRRCDRAADRKNAAVQAQVKQHKVAVQCADLIRDGFTVAAIARGRRTTYKAVSYIMKSACPPFLPPAPLPDPKPKPIPIARTRGPLPVAPMPSRPDWTYPGETLRRLAHEARAEIEASGWFGRRNAS